MHERSPGRVVLAGALLVAGLVGLAVSWRVLPRDANTSPLAALFALTWSSACLVTGVLAWTRSGLAPLSLAATIGLLLFPASFVFPARQHALPASIVVVLLAGLAYGYLRRHRRAALSRR